MTIQSKLFAALKHGLVVSCQALPHEPLHDPSIMGKMAYAAMLGGAVGIRANSVADIAAIRKTVDLPIIGIIKADYPHSGVFITPTEAEVAALVAAGVDMIAMDATSNRRPSGKYLNDDFPRIREHYPDAVFMADCATVGDARNASALGFDCVATTLVPAPFDPLLVKQFGAASSVPVIAEGGIWTPEQMAGAFDNGAHCVVVGTAITRPMEITKRFVAAIPGDRNAQGDC
ncbi:MAG: N-acetylmannosamine-6-phosphate 2-epimerase [Paenibacillaceae bacterium]|nr:N-acetylmannosamine-6-phosphate 2-epimerase [Paenibacillaceae bacterium]